MMPPAPASSDWPPVAALAGARDAAVVCDLAPSSVLAISGPDAAAFLQGQLSSDVTALADARIPGAKMERRQGNVVSDDLIDEARELHLRIRRIREAHCCIGVTEAPARAERHAAWRSTAA